MVGIGQKHLQNTRKVVKMAQRSELKCLKNDKCQELAITKFTGNN